MPPPDGRSPIAIGFEWASRIFVAGMALVLPVLAGVGFDRRYASPRPIGTLLGVLIGLIVGIIQLVRVARAASPPR